MKALKSLVAAAVLTTTFAAAAQTVSAPSTPRDARDNAFGEFVYDALGATPKVQLKMPAKPEQKAATEQKTTVAKAKDTRTARDVNADADVSIYKH